MAVAVRHERAESRAGSERGQPGPVPPAERAAWRIAGTQCNRLDGTADAPAVCLHPRDTVHRLPLPDRFAAPQRPWQAAPSVPVAPRTARTVATGLSASPRV